MGPINQIFDWGLVKHSSNISHAKQNFCPINKCVLFKFIDFVMQ